MPGTNNETHTRCENNNGSLSFNKLLTLFIILPATKKINNPCLKNAYSYHKYYRQVSAD